jgi:hypothetical protein
MSATTIPALTTGQPLDLQYVSAMVEAINTLTTSVNSASKNLSTIKNQENQAAYDLTSNISFNAGFKEIITNKYIDPGNLEAFSYKFEPSFNKTPVVTITPVNSGGTTIGQDITVVINNVNSGEVTGWLKFNNTSGGNATVGINVIAVGFQTPRVLATQ